jgi:hypothetical protein
MNAATGRWEASVDAALEQLLPQIRDAVQKDGTAIPQSGPAIADLLPQVRESLQKDAAAAGEDDERIAAYVIQLLPSLQERIKQAHSEARTRIERDQPWGLAPLDATLDLLSPLGKAHSELAHTQCLAYLLDHRAAHGLGIRCLRALFALVGRHIQGDDAFEKLSIETDENNERLRRVNVYAERCVESLPDKGSAREERRCDVWVELVEEGRSLVVIIENKIDAGEHSSQLSGYEQSVWQWARKNRRLSLDAKLIFLTPDGGPLKGRRTSSYGSLLATENSQLLWHMQDATRQSRDGLFSCSTCRRSSSMSSAFSPRPTR